MRKSPVIAIVSLSMMASQSHAAQKGFSGELSIMTGFTSSESNFNTDNPIKTDSLTSDVDAEQDWLVIPLGQLRYNFGSNANQELFLGTSRADIIQGVAALEVGYKYWLRDRSFLAVSVLPTIMKSETWADPFLVNESRQTTDESGNAYRFQYENIVGTGLNADIGYYTKDIDNELSGSGYSESVANQLQREGYGLYSKLSWTIYAGPGTFIQPGVRRNAYSAEGDAQSSTLWGYSLTLIRRSNQHFLALTADYTQTDFDTVHSIFGETRDDTQLGATAVYQYNNLMGYQNLAANVLITYSDLDSNLVFYDKKTLFSAVGLTLKF
ncbi:DUF2860 family protein [Vibrio algarum]|uniref:DUF2860 family protein n=1 Tax=Vibrio algarum TaxID=3020714 RepID=A0ABT4YQX3_9VIBR|nr:DUF2860 family protein [Vibrio sp. KJ40-1]MDB1123797.1 DUF2860 family protein [Vibrio sp. KJ40-1]